MGALAGYKASLYATTTPSVAFTNEAFTDAGDHKNYTISNSVKTFWDNATALTVQTSPDAIVWTTVTVGFTVNYCGGIITFASAVTGATPSCRVSGNYLPYSLVGDAKEVDVTVTLDILDSTSFNTTGWKTKTASLVGAEMKVNKWWIDLFYVTALATSRRMVLSAYSGANANQRIQGFGYIKDDSLKVAINALVEESLTFDIDGVLSAILT